MKSLRMSAVFGLVAVFAAAPLALAQDAAKPTSSTETYDQWNLTCARVAAPAPAPAVKDAKADTAKKDETKKDDAKKDEAKKDDTKADAAKGEGKNLCEVSQVFTNRNNGGEVARVSFFVDPAKKDQFAFGLRSLVDVSFEKPIRIVDGEKELAKGAFKRCAGNFCFGLFDGNPVTAAMNGATSLALEFPLSSGQVLRVAMSGKGLTAALAALKSHP